MSGTQRGGPSRPLAHLPHINPDVEYLRRLGAWLTTKRGESGESQLDVVKAMARAGLDWSDRVLRALERLATLPDDADVSHAQINVMVVRFLAHHYGSSLSELETYLTGGGTDPTAARGVAGRIARYVAQMTPDQQDTTERFAAWVVESDARLWTPAVERAQRGRQTGPLYRPPSTNTRVAAEQAALDLEASAEEAERLQRATEQSQGGESGARAGEA